MPTSRGKIGPIEVTSAYLIVTSARRNVAQGANGTNARSRRSEIARLCAFRDRALAIGAEPPSGSGSRSARGHRATMRISARALTPSVLYEQGPGAVGYA